MRLNTTRCSSHRCLSHRTSHRWDVRSIMNQDEIVQEALKGILYPTDNLGFFLFWLIIFGAMDILRNWHNESNKRNK